MNRGNEQHCFTGNLRQSHGDMRQSHGDMRQSHGDMRQSHGDTLQRRCDRLWSKQSAILRVLTRDFRLKVIGYKTGCSDFLYSFCLKSSSFNELSEI
jgi:hypothetical protein